jgi:hypothetical protein
MRALQIRHKVTNEIFKEASKRETLESRAKRKRPKKNIHPLRVVTANLRPLWMGRQFLEQPSAGERIRGPG